MTNEPSVLPTSSYQQATASPATNDPPHLPTNEPSHLTSNEPPHILTKEPPHHIPMYL